MTYRGIFDKRPNPDGNSSVVKTFRSLG
jgi:hypothetical protein